MASTILPSAQLIHTRAPILTPTAMNTALAVVTVVAALPLVHVAYAGRPEMLPATTMGLWAMAVLSPLSALLKGTVLGGVAWSVMVLTGARPRYRALMSAVIYAQVIFGLQGAWVTSLLWLRGTAALHRPSDLLLPTGLDVFVSDPGSALGAVARSVTPFHAAWFLFLTVVAARVARGGWWRGALAAGAIWSLVVGLGVVRALMVA